MLGWGTTLVSNHTNILRIGSMSNQLINYFWSNDFSWISTHLVNGWNQIAVTYDGSSEKAYVNGAFESSYTPSPAPNVSLTSVSIGGKIFSGDIAFTGLIDDVRIYNRALSASEIAAMYAGGK